ncbi:MAG: glycosyltransferase family 4 protein [Variibacter sp.]|nr:glycosyltransferase family 4 protein [Variibacter sp.]
MNVMPARATLAPARRRPLRIAMLGLRGFPPVQGGVESHVAHLSRQLVQLGCQVEAIVRSPYVNGESAPLDAGIRFVSLWAPRIAGVEALVHSFLGVLRAAWTRPDVLHIHAIGPAVFAPLARLFGLRVVVTHHVLNYENEKWGPFGRSVLRVGERLGMRWAQGRIAVSPSLAALMRKTYAVPVAFIPNGIEPTRPPGRAGILAQYGLERGRYVLTVARIDPQKRQLDLIEAFAKASTHGWKLALAGGADYSSAYAREVARAAQAADNVVMLGHQSGDALAELFAHAGVFVLPSGHEGQPIAALEAIGYGCPLILSDIPAHREIVTSASRYVPVGDGAALAHLLGAVMRGEQVARIPDAERERMVSLHDWRRIAEQTLAVYEAASAEPRAGRAPAIR